MGIWRISAPRNLWSAEVYYDRGLYWAIRLSEGYNPPVLREVLPAREDEAWADQPDLELAVRALAEITRRGGAPSGADRVVIIYRGDDDEGRWGRLEQGWDADGRMAWTGEILRRVEAGQNIVVWRDDFGAELTTGLRWVRHGVDKPGKED